MNSRSEKLHRKWAKKNWTESTFVVLILFSSQTLQVLGAEQYVHMKISLYIDIYMYKLSAVFPSNYILFV